MNKTRVCTSEERDELAGHYESALVLLRAQGLEPDCFDKSLRDRVLAGEISLEESIEIALEHSREEFGCTQAP